MWLFWEFLLEKKFGWFLVFDDKSWDREFEANWFENAYPDLNKIIAKTQPSLSITDSVDSVTLVTLH